MGGIVCNNNNNNNNINWRNAWSGDKAPFIIINTIDRWTQTCMHGSSDSTQYTSHFSGASFLSCRFFLINFVHEMANPIEWDSFGANLLTIEWRKKNGQKPPSFAVRPRHVSRRPKKSRKGSVRPRHTRNVNESMRWISSACDAYMGNGQFNKRTCTWCRTFTMYNIVRRIEGTP